MTRTLPRLAAAALLALGLVACGSSAGSAPSGAAPSAIATPPPPDGASDEDANAAAAGTDDAKKVSANTAAENEIADALAAAGVGDPGRWAGEVVAHRPYPAGDPDLAALRRALTGAGAGPEANKILSALTP